MGHHKQCLLVNPKKTENERKKSLKYINQNIRLLVDQPREMLIGNSKRFLMPNVVRLLSLVIQQPMQFTHNFLFLFYKEVDTRMTITFTKYVYHTSSSQLIKSFATVLKI